MKKLALLLIAIPSIAFADKAISPGTHDCGKEPNVAIGNGAGKYTFKGACKKISLGGGMNTLTIEGSVEKLALGGGKNTITAAAIDELDIGGAGNTITVETLGSLKVGGVGNTVTWKKAKTGDKPAMKGQLDKNTITQTK